MSKKDGTGFTWAIEPNGLDYGTMSEGRMADMAKEELAKCPRCGSTDTGLYFTTHSMGRVLARQYRCQHCKQHWTVE